MPGAVDLSNLHEFHHLHKWGWYNPYRRLQNVEEWWPFSQITRSKAFELFLVERQCWLGLLEYQRVSIRDNIEEAWSWAFLLGIQSVRSADGWNVLQSLPARHLHTTADKRANLLIQWPENNAYHALEFVLAWHQMRNPKKERLGGTQRRTVYGIDYIVVAGNFKSIIHDIGEVSIILTVEVQ